MSGNRCRNCGFAIWYYTRAGGWVHSRSTARFCDASATTVADPK